MIAVGVIAALQEKGYRVPYDVGIVGFDDISISKYLNPTLTTIAQDMKQLGKISAKTLINKIEDPNKKSEEIILNAKMIMRESVLL